jgi:hypothetical protein
MPTVYFKGRVLPEAQEISIGPKPTIQWEETAKDLSMEFICDIKNSLVNIQCKLNRWQEEFLPDLYRRALDLSRASVELVGFAKGCALSVYLDSFIDHEGIEKKLLLEDLSLSTLCTAFNLNCDFDVVQTLVLQEPNLFMALHELIEAISIPHASLVNCARCVERIKHLLAPGQSDKQAWTTMRTTLMIDESYIRYVTDNSKNSRHGRGSYVDGTVTTEVTRRAWAIFDRYLHYKKNGKRLPANMSILSK